MAKPCRYQLPGTDTWMSESEFKKALNDGLIDKFMTENNIAVRGLKPKAVSNPVCSPRFRVLVSETVQIAAFATGVLPNLYVFHHYTGNSTILSGPLVAQYQVHFLS